MFSSLPMHSAQGSGVFLLLFCLEMFLGAVPWQQDPVDTRVLDELGKKWALEHLHSG